jgi:hypothetical protein
VYVGASSPVKYYWSMVYEGYDKAVEDETSHTNKYRSTSAH